MSVENQYNYNYIPTIETKSRRIRDVDHRSITSYPDLLTYFKAYYVL